MPIFVFSLVVPALVQADETELPLAPELLPLPAVVPPPVVDTMRSVATPTPDRLPVPPEPTREVPSEMKEPAEPLCESRSLCDFWGYRVS